MIKVVTIIATIIICQSSLNAQCPDRDSLWNRLKNIRDDPPTRAGDNLKELNGYLLRINSCPYKNDSTHAFLIRLIGAKHATQKDFSSAISYYRQSVDIIKKGGTNPAVNQRHLLGNYYWLSVFYDSIGNTSEFRKALDSSIAIGTRLKSIGDISCIRALYSRAEHFYDIGDYHRCIEDATMCEKLAWEYAKSKNWLDYAAGSTIASSSLGWNVQAHLKIGKYDEATQLLSNKISEFKRNKLTNYLGMVHGQLAQVEIQHGNYPKAITYLDKEFYYNNAAGLSFNCKQSLNALGYEVYFKGLHNNTAALATLQQALAISNTADYLVEEDMMESLNICANIANIHVYNRDFNEAFLYFQKAFDQMKPGWNENYIFNAANKSAIPAKKIHYLVSLLIDKGDAYQKQFEATGNKDLLQQAIRTYKTTDRLLETIKQNISDLQSKLFWRSNSTRLYESAISAAYQLHSPDDAFYFFEKSRAVLLQDQLAEQRWLVEKDAGARIQIRTKINFLERSLTDTATGSLEKIKLNEQLFDLRQQLDLLNQSIRASNPLYYQSFIETKFIDINNVQQQLLKDHQALVELFNGDSTLYVLVITPKKSTISKVNKQEFEKTATQFVAYLSDFNRINRNYKQFAATATALYQLILGSNPVPKGRIIVSPGGNYFPFEALNIASAGEPVRYFVQDHAVSYTYSARFLLQPSSNVTNKNVKDFLGMAPESFHPKLKLSTLSGSIGSLQRLEKHFSNHSEYLAEQASRNNFLNEFGNYRIVQLYTHGAAINTSTREPVIYFNDSMLYLSDLMRSTKPATRLILLSACETGLGMVNRGEGVFSFNRAFAAVGIPSSIINLWSVENKSTYRLTELFYKHLSAGLPIDQALQQAKIEFIEKVPSKAYELPYFWAAPVLAGKTDAIELNQDRNMSVMLLGSMIMLVILIGGMLYWRLRNKHNTRDSWLVN